MAILTNFNAGELSPLLFCRNDLEKYISGAKCMENFQVLPQGGIQNRPGTEFIAEVRDSSRNVRLVPFEFNVEQAYVLEFGDLYVRIRNRDTLLLSAEVSVPYAHTTLRKLRWVQSADVLYLVHPDYPPGRLCRYGENDWRYEVVNFSGGPFLDENATETTITASATTGTITLTATDAIFDVPEGGMLWQVTHPNQTSILNHVFERGTKPGIVAEPESDTIKVKGKWSLKSSGGWYGTVKLKRSFDNGETWNDFRAWTSEQNTNIDSEGLEDRDNVLYKIIMEDWREPESDSVTYKCNVVLTIEKYWIHGIVKLDPTNGKTNTATGCVIEELGDTKATADWAEGAWNEKNGYPTSICFYQDRLVFAGSRKQPQTVWFSKTGDYHNFEAGTDADEAMVFTLRTNEVNAISWMLPRDEIIIGTQAAEGLLQPVNSDEPLSPDNRRYTEKTAYGSGSLPAILVQDCIVFLQRGGEHFREFSYDYAKDGYMAPDMSILAEHILAGGALEVCFKPLPFPALYFVRTDGQIAGFTYERLQNVTAWYRFVTDGSFESVAVVSNLSGDELWAVVRRGEKRFIERFFQRECSSPEESVFLDCAKRSASGLEHLEGRTVTAVVDGKTIEHLTVTNGTVEVPTHTRILVGLPYVSRWESMPLEFMAQTGSSQGIRKKISKVKLVQHHSLGGKAGCGSGTLQNIDQRKTFHPMDSVPPLQSESFELVIPSRYVDRETLVIEQDAPLPLTILAVVHNMEVTGQI